MEVLETCVIGKARGRFDTSWLKTNFIQHGASDVWAIRLSTDRFMIGFANVETRSMMEEDKWEWLGQWFSVISPWGQEEMMESRLAEIQIYGLPLVFWKKDNIERISNLWGSMDMIESSIENPDDIRVCTVTIETRQMDRIEEMVEVSCGNFKVEVRVRETNRKVQWVDVGEEKGWSNVIVRNGGN